MHPSLSVHHSVAELCFRGRGAVYSISRFTEPCGASENSKGDWIYLSYPTRPLVSADDFRGYGLGCM